MKGLPISNPEWIIGVAMIATLLSVGAGAAQTEGPLRVQLEQCLEAVMTQDATPFDAYEVFLLAMDEERDGFPNIRRMFEPEAGASMVLFGVSPLYYDDATEAGADCTITVPVEQEDAFQILSEFRTELADRFGEFAPYTADEMVWNDVTCVAERPLLITLREETAIGGGRAHSFAIRNYTQEGTSC